MRVLRDCQSGVEEPSPGCHLGLGVLLKVQGWVIEYKGREASTDAKFSWGFRFTRNSLSKASIGVVGFLVSMARLIMRCRCLG